MPEVSKGQASSTAYARKARKETRSEAANASSGIQGVLHHQPPPTQTSCQEQEARNPPRRVRDKSPPRLTRARNPPRQRPEGGRCNPPRHRKPAGNFIHTGSLSHKARRVVVRSEVGVKG